MTDHCFRLSNGRQLGYAACGDPGGAVLFYHHGWPSGRRQGELGWPSVGRWGRTSDASTAARSQACSCDGARGLNDVAKRLGEGDNYKTAYEAHNTLIGALKELRKGKA
jgi:hypothetical protein